MRLLEFDERAGPTRRRNDALAAAEGSLLGWLDHDDLWLPEKLEKQVAVLDQRPEVGLVYSGYEAFDSATGDVSRGATRRSRARATSCQTCSQRAASSPR